MLNSKRLFSFAMLAAFAAGCFAPTPAQPFRPNAAAENVLIILDASESMTLPAEGSGGGETRMAAAKRVIIETLGKIPPGVNVGLRVYGDEPTYSNTACEATRTLVPMGANNRMQIASSLVGLKAIGMTPISYSLKRAVNEDFVRGPKNSIILVSDGEETCSRVDPCDLAVDMVKHGVDVKINVVGYGIEHNLDAARQLKCVALATKGKFYNTSTSAQLADAVGELFNVKKEVHAEILTPAAPAQPSHRPQPKPVQELQATPAPGSRR